jgi:ATP-dependent Clp protease ATP-binding subunit ClpA
VRIDASRAELSAIRARYTQFKHCKVSDDAMRAYAQYMSEKIENKFVKKEKLRDLGLANIDSYVMIDQMQRNDSKNYELKKTSDNRASLKDLNTVRPSNYLTDYLERMTGSVKVSKHRVKAI